MINDATTLDLPAMRAHAGEAVTMLKLLGNEDRLMLLCQLTEGERTVGELEQLTGIGQPTLSQQLGVLRRDGLVQTRREGKFIWYQLADDRALLPVVLGTQGAAAAQAEGAEEATTRVRALKAPCTIWRGMTVSEVDTPAPGQGRTGRRFQLICPTFWLCD